MRNIPPGVLLPEQRKGSLIGASIAAACVSVFVLGVVDRLLYNPVYLFEAKFLIDGVCWSSVFGVPMGAVLSPVATRILRRKNLGAAGRRLILLVPMEVLCVHLCIKYFTAGPMNGFLIFVGGYVFLFILGCLMIARLLPNQRLSARYCRECEYDLTGNVSGVCPECGERK